MKPWQSISQASLDHPFSPYSIFVEHGSLAEPVLSGKRVVAAKGSA